MKLPPALAQFGIMIVIGQGEPPLPETGAEQIDLLTVFVSQNRVIQAKAQLLAVQRLRLENRVNLHLALGGDYRPHAPSTATAPH